MSLMKDSLLTVCWKIQNLRFSRLKLLKYVYTVIDVWNTEDKSRFSYV